MYGGRAEASRLNMEKLTWGIRKDAQHSSAPPSVQKSIFDVNPETAELLSNGGAYETALPILHRVGWKPTGR